MLPLLQSQESKFLVPAPFSQPQWSGCQEPLHGATGPASASGPLSTDRKSTRLNSSHLVISYAVFCLKKKNKISNMPMGNSGPNVHLVHMLTSACYYAASAYVTC